MLCNLLDEFTLIFRQLYDDFNISIFQVTPPYIPIICYYYCEKE